MAHRDRAFAARSSRVFASLIMLVALAACSDPPLLPDASQERPANVDSSGSTRFGPTGTPRSVIHERAWIIDTAQTRLVSSAEDLESGVLRLRDQGAHTSRIRRDDVMLAVIDGARVPRRVLSVRVEGDTRVFDTGPALWSDVFNSGDFGLRASLQSGEATTLAGDVMSVSDNSPIPTLGGPVELDLCAVVDSIAQDGTQLCGKEQETDKTVKGVTISVGGTIDSLAILDGAVEVTGQMALAMSIDGGGVTGGTPPVFAPCHLAAYAGCLKTPTGAAWIDWLRRHAPSVPEASLRPVRVCAPGTPIRTRAGRWQGLRWIPPQYQTCTVASIGQLPTVVRPSLLGMTATIQPRLTGGMTLFAKGDGRLGLRLPVPKLALNREQESGDIEASLVAGVFIDMDLEVRNASGWARADVDEEVRITQTWTPTSGWSEHIESIRSSQTFDYGFDNPDSLVVKVFLPKYAVELSATVEPEGTGLEFGASQGLEFGPFTEITWSREQVHPTDPDIDNWHLAVEEAYELSLSAGVDLPDEFQHPNVETSWAPTYEFGRRRNNEDWGLANLIVETVTTGTNVDTDGYTVLVDRADTLPTLFAAGTIRDGDARDHGTRMERALDATDVVVFERPTFGCGVAYSDSRGAVAKSIVRRAGFSLPNYFIVSQDCNLLVARHRVQLTGVAANCTVEDGAVRDSVWLLQRRFGANARTDTARVTFNVHCSGPAASGAISASAAGLPQGTPLELRLNGDVVGQIKVGEPRLLSGLDAAAGYVVSLHALPFLCVSTPEAASVQAGATTTVSLMVICAEFSPAAGTARVRLQHAGPLPPQPFALFVDGVARTAVSPGSDVTIEELVPGTASTLLLTSPVGQCRVVGANPRVIGAGGSVVNFSTACTTAEVDTLTGIVATSAFPVASASLQTVSGASVLLTGELASDLLQLGGATVRLHGVLSGTSIDVHAYTAIASTTEARWTGVIAERDGTLWLFGEEAIELVDAPPALAQLTGAFVWIGGDEVSVQPQRITPRVFGVIRGAQP